MSDHSSDMVAVLAALTRLEAGQVQLVAGQAHLEAGQAQLEAGQVQLRIDVMGRIDRLQNRMEALFNDTVVNWHSNERLERKVDGEREQTRMLTEHINELTKALRRLEGRVASLEDKP